MSAWHVQCHPETWASWKCSRKTPHPALGAGQVLLGCSDKSAQTGQPQTTKVDSLTVPEVSIRNPVHWAKSRGVRRTVLPPKAPGQNLVFASCSFWGLPALLSWCHATLVSASTVPWPSPLLSTLPGLRLYRAPGGGMQVQGPPR